MQPNYNHHSNYFGIVLLSCDIQLGLKQSIDVPLLNIFCVLSVYMNVPAVFLWKQNNLALQSVRRHFWIASHYTISLRYKVVSRE